MGVHLLPFLGVSVLLVIAPGPDTLLVAKNALLRGRRDGLATVAGVSLGLVICGPQPRRSASPRRYAPRRSPSTC